VKILLSWSSGKDSAWALHVLNRTYPGAMGALLTTVNEARDRVAMHAVRQDVLQAQAAAAELPLRRVYIPEPCSNEQYEQQMTRAVEAAVRDGFTHVAFGDLFLEDVRRYREERLAATPLEPLFPIWRVPTPQLAGQMIDAGVRARLVCIDTRVVAPGFAGREFDRTLLAELPVGVDPCGENGEFHTCVYAGPMFRHEISLEAAGVVHRDPFIWTDLILCDPATATLHRSAARTATT
jgi:uncharacterized protein (TIGR00290 family)